MMVLKYRVNIKSIFVHQWYNDITNSFTTYLPNELFFSWSANQVVGPANIFPCYGDRTGTWAQKDLDANQYIEAHQFCYFFVHIQMLDLR